MKVSPPLSLDCIPAAKMLSIPKTKFERGSAEKLAMRLLDAKAQPPA